MRKAFDTFRAKDKALGGPESKNTYKGQYDRE